MNSVNDQSDSKPPRMWILVTVAVSIAFVGGFLLIGIPGALLLELVGLAYQYFGLTPIDMPTDSVWPTAIMISLLWPFALIPLSIFYHKYLPTHSAVNRWLFSLIGSVVLVITLTFLALL